MMEVLADMEYKGVKLDKEMLAQFSKELESDLKKLEAEIYEKAGEEFNISS